MMLGATVYICLGLGVLAAIFAVVTMEIPL